MPSILDRLIDPDSAGTAWRQGYGVQQVVDAVRRDLEELLNTRLAVADLPEEFVELRRSILVYGLPDLASLNVTSSQLRDQVGRMIEVTLERFEPRLRDIRARMVGGGDSKERSVRFHIDARLGVDPAPEVGFETVLELTTGHASITPSEG